MNPTPDRAPFVLEPGQGDDVGVTVVSTQPLPETVRQAPRLWSLLYDELSASDRRWVLDTIARHGRA